MRHDAPPILLSLAIGQMTITLADLSQILLDASFDQTANAFYNGLECLHVSLLTSQQM
jgi:hypothetical protein